MGKAHTDQGAEGEFPGASSRRLVVECEPTRYEPGRTGVKGAARAP
jgi:hypothetical protein